MLVCLQDRAVVYVRGDVTRKFRDIRIELLRFITSTFDLYRTHRPSRSSSK